MDLTAPEIRVLGCLLEKQRATPDQYPLTLNSLRLACNQATNRDPVVEYDEQTIREALTLLSRRRWVRLASGYSSRASKYRHLLEEALGLEPQELALLAVLMLRGPQTPGELKQRSERLHHFGGLDEIELTLERLTERGLARRLERRPGQKEARHRHLLDEDAAEAAGDDDRSGAAPIRVDAAAGVPDRPAAEAAPDGAAVAGPARAAEQDRLARVEQQLATLRSEVAELRAALAERARAQPATGEAGPAAPDAPQARPDVSHAAPAIPDAPQAPPQVGDAAPAVGDGPGPPSQAD